MQANSGDDATFSDLLATHQVLFNFPSKGWLFKLDPEAAGVGRKWQAPGLDTHDWISFEIRKFWEEQGWANYDGVAWYRHTFTGPALPEGKKIQLVVGAVDESATVWINGEKAGEFDEGDAGWDKRFSLDVTGKLASGRENQIVFRVLDQAGAGGLWKGIRLLAEK
jgi:sialate O-acetylesterase